MFVSAAFYYMILFFSLFSHPDTDILGCKASEIDEFLGLFGHKLLRSCMIVLFLIIHAIFDFLVSLGYFPFPAEFFQVWKWQELKTMARYILQLLQI